MEEKVLLVGRAGAGKTSMRSVIFANALPKDTMSISATHEIDYRKIKFMKNMELSLWDCGGQEIFLESYFTGQRERVFNDTKVLIFVLEVRVNSLQELEDYPLSIKKKIDTDIDYLSRTTSLLDSLSPSAIKFILIHKMDLCNPNERTVIESKYTDMLRMRVPGLEDAWIKGTSIWDESLYRAWSAIVTCLLPQVDLIENMLKNLAASLMAEEIILFESSTYLTIALVRRDQKDNPKSTLHYERLSNILKQFKLSTSKVAKEGFENVSVKLDGHIFFVEKFTNNMIAAIVLNESTSFGGNVLNLEQASFAFQELEDQWS